MIGGALLKVIRGIIKIRGNTSNELVGNNFTHLNVGTIGYFIDLAEGNLPGCTFIRKFGFNRDIDVSSSPEDVWSVGGLYPFPSAANATTIVSTSANDTSGGTGARTVEVQGLDSSFDLVTETVTMNGTTPVNVPTNLIRCFRLIVRTAGSLTFNDGEIDVLHSPTVIARIDENKSQTTMAIYTIPNGKTGYMFSWYYNISRNASATGVKEGLVELEVMEENAAFRVIEMHFDQSDNPPHNRNFLAPERLPAKTDIKITLDESGGNNMAVSAGFEILLVDD